jgi:hypothetical protein
MHPWRTFKSSCFFLFSGRIIGVMEEKPAPVWPITVEQDIALRKPHEMIVMVPRSATVTLTARRIYTVLLQVSQTRLDRIKVMPPADFMFEAPLLAVLKGTGSKGGDRTAAKKYLAEMRSIEVDWESTAPGDGIKWRGFSMLSEVALEVRRGENWVSWMFPPSIMAALMDPQRWARIDLDVLASLDTYASIALYEICVRYRDNPGGLTSRKPPKWWTDALSNMPGGDRREWRKFKNERIKPAVAEINGKTDLAIELVEHKQGRALIEVQFSVRRKVRQAAAKPVHEPVDAGLVLRAQTLGISESKVDALIREFDLAQVDLKLGELERRMVNTTLKAVENAYSYLRALLLKSSEDALGQEAVVQLPRVAKSVQIVDRRELQPLTADSVWQGERMRMLMQELEVLPDRERRHWLNLAVQDLSERGVLTSAVSRRAALGEITRGVLGSKAIQIYAETTYGPGWNTKPPSELDRNDSVASLRIFPHEQFTLS